MTGLVPNNQDEPLDPEAYRHHLLLLKSMHCCRQVIHKGLRQFISGLSLYQDGGRVSMVVWIAGQKEGVDSAEIEIASSIEPVQRPE